jgi:hypothetical protein
MTFGSSARCGLWQGIAIMTVVSVAVAPGLQAHDEHDWIRNGRYRSPLTNEWCCGKEDCVPIPADQVEPTVPGWRIAPTGEVVPYIDTLPSEDGRFWRCHQPNGVRRCFFAPPRMS